MPELAPLVRTFKATMEAWMPEFEADLAWLVGRDRGSGYKAGVDAAAEWMRARLEALGCATEVFPSASTGNTITGTLRGQGRGRYLLIAHLDTVWPEGTAAAWPMVIEGHRATGPGVIDNASGSLTGLYALKALQHLGCNDFEAITLLCNTDEETGSVFSGAVIQQVARGHDAAFCLEAPAHPDELIGQRGGSMGVELRVAGRRAHTQIEPERGANAILELCHKVIAAHELADPSQGVLISVVTIEGGPQSGTVPDDARAEIDVCFNHMEDVPRLLRCFREIADRAWVPGTQTTLTSRIYHPPMEQLPGTARLVGLAQAIGRELGTGLKDTYCAGVADGSFATVVGVPTLCGLTPYGNDYHTRGEWLDLTTVPFRVALVAGLVAGADRASGA